MNSYSTTTSWCVFEQGHTLLLRLGELCAVALHRNTLTKAETALTVTRMYSIRVLCEETTTNHANRISYQLLSVTRNILPWSPSNRNRNGYGQDFHSDGLQSSRSSLPCISCRSNSLIQQSHHLNHTGNKGTGAGSISLIFLFPSAVFRHISSVAKMIRSDGVLVHRGIPTNMPPSFPQNAPLVSNAAALASPPPRPSNAEPRR